MSERAYHYSFQSASLSVCSSAYDGIPSSRHNQGRRTGGGNLPWGMGKRPCSFSHTQSDCPLGLLVTLTHRQYTLTMKKIVFGLSNEDYGSQGNVKTKVSAASCTPSNMMYGTERQVEAERQQFRNSIFLARVKFLSTTS